jgi:hypothetical protein
MIIKHTKCLVNKGAFTRSAEYQNTTDEIKSAICSVSWPHTSKVFSINPIKKGNGVVPIKYQCLSHLKQLGWHIEDRIKLLAAEKPGPVDALKVLPNGDVFAFEWETGNISSSHRALNKMSVAMLERRIIGGALVIPSRSLYEYLTDRVGNFQELEPYFPVWQSIPFKSGVLIIYEIQHDKISEDVEVIPKGSDGNSYRKLIQ